MGAVGLKILVQHLKEPGCVEIQICEFSPAPAVYVADSRYLRLDLRLVTYSRECGGAGRFVNCPYLCITK